MTKHANHHNSNDRTYLGFWIYLMTDLIMFSVLFATYAVLKNNTHSGPTSQQLFNLPLALVETLILLVSSFTCGLGVIYAQRNHVKKTVWLMGITFVLGLVFLSLELFEFYQLIKDGHDWTQSAFLSAFFGLLGTHGVHIVAGLLWLVVTLGYLYKRGLNDHIVRKLTLLGIYWHFLDIVWVFIFTFVYLMGSIS